MGSIIKVFFGSKTMTFPKAVLICSLLTKYLTEAVLLDSWCPAGPQQWNDQYVNVGSGLAHSRRSEEILWEPRRNVRSRRNWISATLGRGGRRLKGRMKLGALDVDAHESIADQLNIQNLPTILYFAPGSSEPEKYIGWRTADDIVRLAEEKLASRGRRRGGRRVGPRGGPRGGRRG